MYIANKSEEIGHFDHGFGTESPRFFHHLKSILIRFIKLFFSSLLKKENRLKVNVFLYI